MSCSAGAGDGRQGGGGGHGMVLEPYNEAGRVWTGCGRIVGQDAHVAEWSHFIITKIYKALCK